MFLVYSWDNCVVIYFCSPIINGKVEDRNVGEGPSLTMMFEDDKHLQHLNEKLKVHAWDSVVTLYVIPVLCLPLCPVPLSNGAGRNVGNRCTWNNRIELMDFTKHYHTWDSDQPVL
jgi:hypothetical protein